MRKLVEKQSRLDGKPFSDEEEDDPDGMDVVKSALQKSIRRRNTEQAMFWALELARRSWYNAWRRLSVIAVEDCGVPETINSVGELYRMFMSTRRGRKNRSKELSWDEQRCIVAAAKILSESPKDRRADEFLELMTAIERRASKSEELSKKLESLSKIEDYFLDVHTVEGRKMHRGNLYWYAVSSETVGKTPAYEEWHKWFQPLMIEIEKKKKEERGA